MPRQDTYNFTMTVESELGRHTFVMRQEGRAFVATLQGPDGTPYTATGPDKTAAMNHAMQLYLHVYLMRMQRGLWHPRIVKHDDGDHE